MKSNKMTLKNFELDQLSKVQQKTIKGGGDSTSATPIDPNDPSKGTGGNGNN